MHKNLYNRIIEYADVIAADGDLPWQGLYTARAVYRTLKKSSKPLYPEDIAETVGLSAETVNQIILALQQGGLNICSAAGEKSWTGRPKSIYFLD